MDLMSDPDAIEELSNGLWADHDLRRLLRLRLLLRHCRHRRAVFGIRRDLEVQRVWRVRAVGVCAVVVGLVDSGAAWVVLFFQAEVNSDAVA